LRKLFYIFLLILIRISFSYQTGDSLFFSPIDSLKKIDTAKPTGDIDAIIEYSATDSAVFDIENRKLMLYNEGELKYKEFNLKASRIILSKKIFLLINTAYPIRLNRVNL